MLLLFVLFAFSFADPADLVSWPIGVYVGAPYSFNFYSGYVNVGSSKFFYWFAESSRSPKSDPLLIFLNGGPGCSSVAGSLSENGPFVAINNGSQITNRETSWNRLANVLWIESPAGVGMSYAPGMPPNYTYSTDDHQTARNNLLFLQGWYHKFPQFQNHELRISGESYAGTYIPTFTVEILKFNQRNPSNPIPLVGLMIGNPCTSELIDHNAFFSLASTHNLIPPTLARAIEATCPATFRYIPNNSCCQFNYSNYPAQSTACTNNLNEMYTLFANNNLYDIYADCASSPSGNAPCIGEDGMPNFLNNPVIRQAIHAAPVTVTGPWSDCVAGNFNYTSNYASIADEVYPQIFAMAPNLDIMIYSGDADACVPFFGTVQWTSQIGGTVTDAWRPWQSSGQLAGYTIGYQRLRFTSLKGCGHMAPRWTEFQPTQSFTMLENYLNGHFPMVKRINPVRRTKPRAE